MTALPEVPAWTALLTAALVLFGSGLTLIGTVGLLRLKTFYERVHAPTLGTTLGLICVLLASIVYFSVLQTRPVVHELLIAFFVTLTTPITLMLLVQATLYRDRLEGRAPLSALREPPAEPTPGATPSSD